jgi:hypothetical protein
MIHHMDIKTAYLNAKLDEDVYMALPTGVKVPEGMEGKGACCKLLRALYGLKQAGRNWSQLLTEVLKGCGFEQCVSDHCAYYMLCEEGAIYVLVYVDDLLFVVTAHQRFKEVRVMLESKFTLVYLGIVKKFLGVAIEVADGVVSWSQAHYIRAVGKRFGIVVDANAKEKCLPIRGDVREILRMVDAEQDEEALSDGEYRQLMGCLLWVAMMTRPDVAWYIGRLSQFFGAPRVRHMNAAMDVLTYLVESADLPMFFKRVECMRVVVYSDSDWANDVPTRKSVSGNVAFLSAQGGTAAISFRSKTQAIPA